MNVAEFRKTKQIAWQTLGALTSSNERVAADAIPTSTAAEIQAHASTDHDAPTVEDPVITMESGAHAGLQTADQVTAQLKRRGYAETRRNMENAGDHIDRGSETIYRDASGRIINVQMKRAEARKKAKDEVAKVAAELEAQKGDVQRAEKEQRRQRLSEAKFMSVARYADDAELNKDLKEKQRWNDPATEFLEKRKEGNGVGVKMLFKGPAAPNRYGIKPGHRWDGVDRGTGFEKEYFAVKNRRSNLKTLDYAWQLDE